ncbi:chemotaxis protein chel [Jannaschia sp. EhC01]|nr:rod-binding protein [Gymnodinialimonas phycosphaerae]OAN69324.1 chemotaxis protein chel [Jannaschia sp. EhC01]
MTTPILSATLRPDGPLPSHDRHAQMREVAEDLEAAFLAEMLKHAGFGEARDHESFGGGIGEEQFSSMLRDEHSRALSAIGGIGLAESIFDSLVRRAEAGQ